MEMGVDKTHCGGSVRGKTILVFKENIILSKMARSDCRGETGLGFVYAKLSGLTQSGHMAYDKIGQCKQPCHQKWDETGFVL